MKDTEKLLEKIAAEHLVGAQERGDLQTRHSGDDFFEVAVWELRAALKAAYDAGMKAGRKEK